MLHSTLQRRAIGGAVAAIALVVTGAAGADAAITRPDDRAAHGPGAIAQTNDWVVAARAGRPDDRATHGPVPVAAAQRDVVVRPDDRADRRLPGGAVVLQPQAGGGFDWLDAGIGAAATFGLVLLVAGASVMRLRQQAQTT